MKSIFLSAGIPVAKPNRNPVYFETADVMAIRDAVLSLVFVCLKLDIKIIWGGHPAITPIVYEAIRNFEEKEREQCGRMNNDELKQYVQKHVHLFQSAWFKDYFPEDNNKFENVTLVPKKATIVESLSSMRAEMLQTFDLSAAIYIGGMEGIIDEDNMFRKYYPQKPTYPIASTGGATLEIFNNFRSDRHYPTSLLDNYGYTSLFYSILKSI